jgi:hypothetical protein
VPPPSSGGSGRAAGEIVPLLAAGAAGEPGVWLELDRRHGAPGCCGSSPAAGGDPRRIRLSRS